MGKNEISTRLRVIVKPFKQDITMIFFCQLNNVVQKKLFSGLSSQSSVVSYVSLMKNLTIEFVSGD
jgi:hypothetical protein